MQQKLYLTDPEIRFIYFGGISRSTLLRWRKNKPGFPKSINVGRRNLTLKSEVIEYLATISGKETQQLSFAFSFMELSPKEIAHLEEKYSANPEMLSVFSS